MIKYNNFDNLLSYAYVAREINRGNKDFDEIATQQNKLCVDIPEYTHELIYFYFVRLIRDYMTDEYDLYKESKSPMSTLLRNSYSKHLGQLADLTGIVFNTFGLPIYDTGIMSDIESVPKDYIVVLKDIVGDIKKKCEMLKLYYILDSLNMSLADVIILWKKNGYRSIKFRTAKIQVYRKCEIVLNELSEKVKEIGVSELIKYYKDTKALYDGLSDAKVTDYYDYMYVLMGVPEQLIPSTIGEGYIL